MSRGEAALQRSRRARARRRLVRGTLLVVCVAAAAAAPSVASNHAGHTSDVSASAFVRDMEAGMRKMMTAMHAPGLSGHPDADFLAMMIPHHQGAVDMARLALVHGGDPLTRRIAEDIIASQTAEIAAMRARLDVLRAGSGADADADGYPALGGHRGWSDGTRGPPASANAIRHPPRAAHH